jgi:hypothetical protein
MSETILGQRKDIDPPSLLPAAKGYADPDLDETSTSAATLDDGYGYLDQPTPILDGVDGSVFAASQFVELQSPILLSILSNTAPGPVEPKISQSLTQSTAQVTAAVPKDLDWEEW